MKQSKYPIGLLGLLAMAICSGCQTFGQTTVRGQSPSPSGSSAGLDISRGRGLYHTPVRSTVDAIQDVSHEHHNTSTYYYGPGGQAGVTGPGYPSAYCPPGGVEGAYCPPAGYQGACPPGYERARCRTGIGQDKFSYGYEVPNDLVYPPAGGVGGAVVYPYYTHKGPSDFFRQ